MNREQLISEIANKSGLTKKDSALALKGFIDTIQSTVAFEEVRLVGFGVFDSRDVPEKSGVCKLQGTETAWTTEAHKKPTFKAGKEFREIVKNGNSE